MVKQRFRLILLLTAVAVGLVVVPASAEGLLDGENALGDTAQDQQLPNIDEVAATDVVSKDLARTLPQQQDVLDYWNSDRMQKAQPTPRQLAAPKSGETPGGVLGDTLSNQGGLPQLPTASQAPANTEPGEADQANEEPAVSDQVPAAPARTTNRSASAKSWANGGVIDNSAGKLMYTMKGEDFVASATVIRSSNKDTLITAGHVIYDRGAYAQNVKFIPGYDHGNAAHGEWTGRSLQASKAWIQRSNSDDHENDVGFITLNQRSDGKSIADVTGAQQIAFNAGKGKPIYAYGYPKESPYDGESLQYCSDTAGPDRQNSSSTSQAIDCDMTPGASGGGWVTDMQSSGVGTVVSVTSFSYENALDVTLGPALGSEAKAAYDEAARS